MYSQYHCHILYQGMFTLEGIKPILYQGVSTTESINPFYIRGVHKRGHQCILYQGVSTRESSDACLAEELLLKLVGPALVGLNVSCQVANVCALDHHLQAALCMKSAEQTGKEKGMP